MKTLQHVTILIVLLGLLYCCVSFSGGTFYYKEWDNIGATVFFMQSSVFLTIFLVGYTVNNYKINQKKKE